MRTMSNTDLRQMHLLCRCAASYATLVQLNAAQIAYAPQSPLHKKASDSENAKTSPPQTYTTWQETVVRSIQGAQIISQLLQPRIAFNASPPTGGSADPHLLHHTDLVHHQEFLRSQGGRAYY